MERCLDHVTRPDSCVATGLGVGLQRRTEPCRGAPQLVLHAWTGSLTSDWLLGKRQQGLVTDELSTSLLCLHFTRLQRGPVHSKSKAEGYCGGAIPSSSGHTLNVVGCSPLSICKPQRQGFPDGKDS